MVFNTRHLAVLFAYDCCTVVASPCLAGTMHHDGGQRDSTDSDELWYVDQHEYGTLGATLPDKVEDYAITLPPVLLLVLHQWLEAQPSACQEYFQLPLLQDPG